ncbi:hypothetical protein CQ018_06155 [Arthrobacter sp. MYb227]|uniref:LolA family protein n=1 Tax=Arthrobacter sp. MYb227 TaxID=1848601 RepID=UPI000CFE1584|nr:outer membrane lipoprotein carrier protein LolA [Arthrobacter sp. MYb227]PQZ94920.1 hypothetical protein CQ018_06155 [Arthrobacter sp. MYb227]
MKPVVLKKWIPAVLAPAVIVAFAVGASVSAKAQVNLEPKTPQQLLELIASSKLTDFSGTTTATVDLGIPPLPDLGGTGMMNKPDVVPDTPNESGTTTSPEANVLSALSAISGTHEARIFIDGPDKARVQVMDSMDEQDFIRNGTTIWKYDSSDNTVTKGTLPETTSMKIPQRRGTPPTPAELTDSLLTLVDPHTEMSMQDGTRIAGRDAYTLELVPRSDDSLVAKVSIGVDAQTGAPLQVVVDAVDQQTPAVSMGFTSFTPETPDAKLFEFTPPAGAHISEAKIPHEAKSQLKDHKNATDQPGSAHDINDAVHGTGWDSVVVIEAKDVPKELAANEMLKQLATPVEGGKLLHISLVNVLLTNDGRMVLGAVSLDRLQAVANGQ